MANAKKCAERTFEKKHLQLAETRHIRKGNVMPSAIVLFSVYRSQ